MNRLPIPKTHKLFIAGQFPRSESGRSLPIYDTRGRIIAHIAHASRKDLRNAVEAAHAAFPRWSSATPYNRAQILYRMAEMLEARQHEFIDLLRADPTPAPNHGTRPRSLLPRSSARKEVEASIDRLICFAGWADKYAQILGCNNPVAGPYYNFTVPEPSGIIAIIASDAPALLGLISLLAPPLCAGNTLIALASEANPLPGIIFGEVCATSDLPPGALNILTGLRDELIPQIASHRDINGAHAAGLSADQTQLLRSGAADNLKRITVHAPLPAARRVAGSARAAPFDETFDTPWIIEPFIEFKTIWHPSGA